MSYLALHKRKLSSWMLSLLCSVTAMADEFEVQLKHPTFSKGILSSVEGGVITGPDLRIQAQKMIYTDKTEEGVHIQKVQAEKDLLFEYKNKVFTGTYLEYDLIHKTGILKDARTSTNYWFVGGDELELLEDGSFWMTNAYLTTAESQDPWWKIYSSKITIKDSYLLSAKQINLKLLNFPLLWLPQFRMNLQFLKEAPIRYKFIWDEVLKQKLSMRYELYSTEDFSLFGRLDYRLKKGPGMAVETNYCPASQNITFQTKSYMAHDKITPDEVGNKRYRFQGLLHAASSHQKTLFHLGYDKLSDDKMPQDFKEEEFELNPQKRTAAWVSHISSHTSSRLTLQPKINSFQSINQKLPLLTTNIKSFSIPYLNVIAQNTFSAGYLSYHYAAGLKPFISNFSSTRLENTLSVYRPFHTPFFSLTPWSELSCLHYGSSEETKLIPSVGFKIHKSLYKFTPAYVYQQTPYLHVSQIALNTSFQQPHPIFSIQDGIVKQQMIKPGLMYAIYPKGAFFFPETTFDLYTYIFLGKTPFRSKMPRLYMTSHFNYPNWKGSAHIVYNFQKQLFDRINTKAAWTVSENFAFALEVRHRSARDWRKSDFTNFALDLKRPVEELMVSPLSDQRNTLLSNIEIKLSPLWSCHLQSHHGWGRKEEKNYNAYEIKLTTLLSGKWQMEMGYKYSPSLREWTFPSIKLLDVKF